MQYCHCCIHMCFCFLAANYTQEEHTHLGNRSPRASSSARSRSGTPLHKPRTSYLLLIWRPGGQLLRNAVSLSFSHHGAVYCHAQDATRRANAWAGRPNGRAGRAGGRTEQAIKRTRLAAGEPSGRAGDRASQAGEWASVRGGPAYGAVYSHAQDATGGG